MRVCSAVICLVCCCAFSGEDAKDVPGKSRTFFGLISSMDASKAELRAQLAKELRELSPEAPADWHKKIGERHKALKSRLEGLLQGPNAASFALQLKGELDTRRKHALDYIQSDAYTKETSKEMENRVASVQELWNDAYKQFLKANENARRAVADVRELEGYLALYPQSAPTKPLDEAALEKNFNETARTVWTPKEAQAVLKYNDEQTWLDEEEQKHLRRLNAYRIQMGRMPLEADVRLQKAARGHSRDMKEKGFFSHESPVPGKKSFVDRAVLEGYRGAGGENIFAGSSSGEAAFNAWYHSPGHHKNMIGGSKQIGAGRFGSHWTQVFGGDGPFALRPGGKPPQIVFAERTLALPESASVAQRMELAQYAVQNKLYEGAREQLNEVLKAEPGNAMAKQVLTFVESELSKRKKG